MADAPSDGTSSDYTLTAPDGVAIAATMAGPTGGLGDGAAPPVVATTGWANDRSVWAPMAADLAADHRVATWDLRGHGKSDVPPPGHYTRHHALGDLSAVCDHARGGAPAGPVVLMGHSFGGFLSLAQAIQRPEDVSALVLVAAGPGFRKAEAREQWNESVRAAATKMDQSPGVEEISMHHDSFVLDHLSEIRCPVLVLLGERDKRFAASASLFARDLDVWASVVVPGQGHMVHLKAAEACAGEVRRFLADVFPVT